MAQYPITENVAILGGAIDALKAQMVANLAAKDADGAIATACSSRFHKRKEMAVPGCEQGYINGSCLAAIAHIQKPPKKSICKAEKKKLYL